MKTNIISFLSLALLLSAPALNAMQNNNQLPEDEMQRLLKIREGLLAEHFPSSKNDNQESEDLSTEAILKAHHDRSDADMAAFDQAAQEDAAILAQRREIRQKAETDLQQYTMNIIEKSKLFEPFQQIRLLIGQFQEFQNNSCLNIPENKSISHAMIGSMQMLLDKAKANYGLKAAEYSDSRMQVVLNDLQQAKIDIAHLKSISK